MAISNYLKNLRRVVGNDLLQMSGVDVVIRDDQNRVLLARHADDGLWALPGGGIEPDDTPAQAAIRECREEVGLDVQPMRILGVYGGPEFHTIYPNGDEVTYTNIVMEAQASQYQIAVDKDEILEARFVDEAEFAHLPMQKFMHVVGPDIWQEHQATYFQPPTWQPPDDHQHHGGMSDYIRGLRDQVGTKQLFMPTAAGIVFDEQGRILLQQRADTGLWSAPGGAVDPHEMPASGVIREVWEEMGLIVEPARLSGVYAGSKAQITYPNGDQAAAISFVFVCQVIGGELRPDKVESLDGRFFEMEELEHLSMPAKWRERIAHALAHHGFAYFDQ